MLVTDIAFGVAGGLLLVEVGKDLLKLPNQVANRRQRDRQHEEFMQQLINVADRAETAAREAMAQKPARRKPATKQAPVKSKSQQRREAVMKAAPKKTVTTKKGK